MECGKKNLVFAPPLKLRKQLEHSWINQPSLGVKKKKQEKERREEEEENVPPVSHTLKAAGLPDKKIKTRMVDMSEQMKVSAKGRMS